MSNAPIVIVGAGLAGLIAAHAWPTAQVVERAWEPAETHRALLRFRTEAVARLTGIPFRRVLVRKGIWHDGRFCAPDVRLANWYAHKCLGKLLSDRSIWATEAVERFIAPDDLYGQLLDGAAGRIAWGSDFDITRAPFSGPVISTAPLDATARAVGLEDAQSVEFCRAGIRVQRVDLGADVDLYQTVYFPDPELALYRASITGRTLIMEYAGELQLVDLARAVAEVQNAFGVKVLNFAIVEDVQQKFGKIAPIDDARRKRMLFLLSQNLNVYSLGRFATWRNILLDDVVSDIESIKRMLHQTEYERRKNTATDRSPF